MISVAEAKAIVSANVIPLQAILLPIEKAANHVLAATVFAICDIPAFAQSSMDGYALKFEDRHQPLQVIGEMAAGVSETLTIKNGEATRIFTGAPLPAGADTVVMQEKINIVAGKLIIKDENLSFGLNVRNQGAEVKQHEVAIAQGTLLTPAAIGYLAQIGITQVSVYPMPSVAIIVTGKELRQPGEPLQFGQVYEANSYALTAALRQANVTDIKVFSADDNLQILTNALEVALAEKDVVILTGGVSVGDYDFVVQAAQQCNVVQLLHKIRQKPGKPLYVGRKNDQLVFGLPGNPSSVLNCFYNYTLPALHQMANQANSVKEIEASLGARYVKPTGLAHFLKGNYQYGIATPLPAQESFRLSSFAQANCLICLPAERENFDIGEKVTTLLLPG
jgi:molybdopterin molybdotransferase